MVTTVYPDATPEGKASLLPPAGAIGADGIDPETAALHVLRGWAECSGPFTVGEMSELLHLSVSCVAMAVAALENEGLVLRGSFRPGVEEEEFCDRRILARIHRATVGRLRREIEPVSQASFMRFLFRWQHAAVGWETAGEGGLLDVIDQLQGFETPAAAWESELLARRVADYSPQLLDRLCTGGEVVWGRLSRANDTASSARSGPRAGPLTRTSGVTFCSRESLDWLLDPTAESVDNLMGAGAEILETLSTRGACFQSDLIAHTRRLPSDVEEALWTLAANGLVTCDSVIPLRARITGNKGRGRPERNRPRRTGDTASRAVSSRRADTTPPASLRSRSQRQVSAGRWSLLESLEPVEDSLAAKAMQLLHRYGVVFPELMARERMAPRWRDLTRIYRTLELRGEIRGGRFVSGFVGEQFALPDAVTALRDAHRAPATSALEVVSACDPLNLVGIVTPGERVPAQSGNRIVFRDGVPVASLEKGVVVNRANADTVTITAATNLLYGPIRPPHPEQPQSFDNDVGTIQQTWALPDHTVLDPVPAARFNLN